MAIPFEGGRIADTSRSWQAAEETAVTDWPYGDVAIVALGLSTTAHSGDTVTPELRWRVNAGSWTALGATGSCKVSDTTALTDDGNLATGNMGTAPGTPVTGNGCEQENSGTASASTTLAKNEGTEIQVGVSFADSSNGDVFEFALYDAGVQIGISVASVTVLVASAALFAADVTGTGTVAGAVTTDITAAAAVTSSATVAGALTTDITFGSALSSSCTVAGALDTSITTAASIGVTGEVSGTLDAAVASLFAGSITSTGTVAGALTTDITTMADITGQGTLAGALATDITAMASVTLQATVAATLYSEGGSGKASREFKPTHPARPKYGRSHSHSPLL